MNLSQVTQAPITIKLAGRELVARPLTDTDTGEYERWMQKSSLEAARIALDGITDSNERVRLMDLAIQRAEQLTVTSPAGIAKMATVEGQIELLFMAIRQDAPTVTRNELRKWLLTDKESMRAIMEALENMEALQDPKPISPATKAAPRRRAKSDKRRRA